MTRNGPFTTPKPLADLNVAIIGLGLMGGSLAMALRGHCQRLLGFDPDPDTLELARREGVVDIASSIPEEVLPEADLIIVATPVLAILDWVHRLPDLVTGPAIVFDLGSTKAHICQAMEGLPERFDPIGGHPMAGKEVSGLAHAEADLYRGAVFALTPTSRTSKHARRVVEALVLAVGARPLIIDPATHDVWVAATSHLPYLVSTALSMATPAETAPLIGPGFMGMARLGGSDPGMMADILVTNRRAILEASAHFRKALEFLESALSDRDPGGVEGVLAGGKTKRDNLMDLRGGNLP
jgi:prephenate dehydrogenase